jgi:hypothetical protein
MRNEAFCSVELYRRTLSDNSLDNYFTVLLTVVKKSFVTQAAGHGLE